MSILKVGQLYRFKDEDDNLHGRDLFLIIRIHDFCGAAFVECWSPDSSNAWMTGAKDVVDNATMVTE